MRYYFVTMLLFFCIYLTGCTKIPGKIQSPGIKIDLYIEDNKEKYSLKFSAGIKNENQDIAFVDFKGNVNFVDPSKSSAVVLSIPFQFPFILPLSSGIIDVEKINDGKKIIDLIDLLNIDKEQLINEKSVEIFNIDKSFINMSGVTYREKDITKLLQEKIDEEN